MAKTKTTESPPETNQSQVQLENLSDRLNVMAEKFMGAVNDSITANAEIRRLTRMVETLQTELTTLRTSMKEGQKNDNE